MGTGDEIYTEPPEKSCTLLNTWKLSTGPVFLFLTLGFSNRSGNRNVAWQKVLVALPSSFHLI